jgi:hypothetical protein
MRDGARSAVHAPLLVLACLAAALAGCAVRRELVVVSEPPGAILQLDEVIVGTTPYQRSFDDYGTRRITLQRTGFRTRSELIDVRPPWYSRFPLDFVSEVLLPFGWKDRQEFRFKLEPEVGRAAEPDLEPVLERAERLRRAGPEGPQPVKPPPRVEPQG